MPPGSPDGARPAHDLGFARRVLPRGDPAGRGIASTGLLPGPGRAIVAIGPEGGFSEAEIGRAVEGGWRTVGLGPTILRVETAALAACSTILGMVDWGDGSIKGPEADR
jgi:16S rRNA (uracil1498-N3)-methyltransferase